MDINILNELVNGILEIMKSSLVQIVLYGSVARGTNTEESDVDVALLVKGALNRATEELLSDFILYVHLSFISSSRFVFNNNFVTANHVYNTEEI